MTQTAINIRVRSQADENGAAISEVSKAGIYTAGIASALIGTWGLACFAGALVTSGGPLSLAANWFTAVAGL